MLDHCRQRPPSYRSVRLARTRTANLVVQLDTAVVGAKFGRLRFLTNDPDVCTWARLEALTGEIGILEAAPSTEEDSEPVDFSAQS